MIFAAAAPPVFGTFLRPSLPEAPATAFPSLPGIPQAVVSVWRCDGRGAFDVQRVTCRATVRIEKVSKPQSFSCEFRLR